MKGKGGKGGVGGAKGKSGPPTRANTPAPQIQPQRYVNVAIPPHLHQAAPAWTRCESRSFSTGATGYSEDWDERWCTDQEFMQLLGVWKPDEQNNALEASLIEAVATDPLFVTAFKSGSRKARSSLTWNPLEKQYTTGAAPEDYSEPEVTRTVEFYPGGGMYFTYSGFNEQNEQTALLQTIKEAREKRSP